MQYIAAGAALAAFSANLHPYGSIKGIFPFIPPQTAF